MVEIIPYMLVILGWHPDLPGEIDLQRPEMVFASAQECSEIGEVLSENMTDAAADKSGARYQFRCLPVPSSSEFETLFSDEARGE